ncbi:MAG: hypothetical protein ABR991_05885 [Terracidiphilus sp.]|jgi:hypothetical protein
MRIAFVLFSCLFTSTLLCAQNSSCSGCPVAEFDPSHHHRAVCLTEKELAAQIATRKPIGPPGLNEPHMNSHGVAVVCLCFSSTGNVKDLRILSGPAMMQQSVIDSMKNWTFRPVRKGERLFGGCGTLRIQIDMNNSQVNSAIEE